MVALDIDIRNRHFFRRRETRRAIATSSSAIARAMSSAVVFLFAVGNVLKADEVDVFAFSVLRDLEQIEHAEETRSLRQRRGDIRKTDLLDGVHLDFTVLIEGIAPSNLHMRPLPDSNADSDVSISDTFS